MNRGEVAATGNLGTWNWTLEFPKDDIVKQDKVRCVIATGGSDTDVQGRVWCLDDGESLDLDALGNNARCVAKVKLGGRAINHHDKVEVGVFAKGKDSRVSLGIPENFEPLTSWDRIGSNIVCYKFGVLLNGNHSKVFCEGTSNGLADTSSYPLVRR